ncbi:MAG: PspA/IM30 family protein [Chloroflexota bacterium]
MSRMTTIIKSKMNDLLDRQTDPRETLEYSYEKQMQLLQGVKRGIVDVVTSKRRLELQAARLHDSVDQMDEQARRALAAGREDLARAALTRKEEMLRQLEGLDAQIDDLEQEQQKLTVNEQRLSLKIEAFRTKKETIKAQYSAAEAQVKIGEAVTGISEEMADVGVAIERAEDKTQRMKAKAAAIDELVEDGTLTDFTTGRLDPVDRELAKLKTSENVENQLASLKQQMGVKGELPAGRGGNEEEGR